MVTDHGARGCEDNRNGSGLGVVFEESREGVTRYGLTVVNAAFQGNVDNNQVHVAGFCQGEGRAPVVHGGGSKAVFEQGKFSGARVSVVSFHDEDVRHGVLSDTGTRGSGKPQVRLVKLVII